MNIRLFLLALFSVGIVVFGCSDGKFNLTLYIPESESEPEPPKRSSTSYIPLSSSEEVLPPSSSSEEEIPSSSSEEEIPPSSSSEEEIPPSSSSEIPPSSSSLEPSSSGRGIRSSDSRTEKVDSNGTVYIDYPTIEIGAPGVKKGVTTRYYDGCKATCSWVFNLPQSTINKEPLEICRACDRYGTTEIPLIYKHPRSNQWGTYYTSIPNAGAPDAPETWFTSDTYTEWRTQFPAAADRSLAYTCFDMTPYAVNDTLAYGFAAVREQDACGKCYRLQFISDEWRYGNPRITHKALKGKTMIVMANNTGTVGEDHFDIMIPGGGFGAFDCFSEQMGEPKDDPRGVFGQRSGGLLSNCVFPNGDSSLPNKPSDRWTLEQWQNCMRDQCRQAFEVKRPNKMLLDGCLWHADWFMAADNPEAYYSETPCPKYLIDRYNSKLTTKLPTDGALDGL